MNVFSPEVVSAVLQHMNTDHSEDSLLIARAFGRSDAQSAIMIGFDENEARWHVYTNSADQPLQMTLPWPAGPISVRPEIRREIVALHEAALAAKIEQTPTAELLERS